MQSLLHSYRSYKGHMDANFNIAILDGHKEFVAHEKFQQLLHKKWGQRDRLQWGDGTPGYNIFWSEMTGFAKSVHVLKQVFVFLVLPIVYLLSMCSSSLRTCKPCNWFLLQSQVGTGFFSPIILMRGILIRIATCFATLTIADSGQPLPLLGDLQAVLLHDRAADAGGRRGRGLVRHPVRLLDPLLPPGELQDHPQALQVGDVPPTLFVEKTFKPTAAHLRYGGTQDRMRVFKRWLTFRNIYILSTDIVFLISVILRCVAYFNDQVCKIAQLFFWGGGKGEIVMCELF